MLRKPFFRSLCAAAYIALIVYVINVMTKATPQGDILVPMTMLALFVLSAAVMGYLFLYEPLELYVMDRKQEALRDFGKTVSIFAIFTAIFVVLLFVL